MLNITLINLRLRINISLGYGCRPCPLCWFKSFYLWFILNHNYFLLFFFYLHLGLCSSSRSWVRRLKILFSILVIISLSEIHLSINLLDICQVKMLHILKLIWFYILIWFRTVNILWQILHFTILEIYIIHFFILIDGQTFLECIEFFYLIRYLYLTSYLTIFLCRFLIWYFKILSGVYIDFGILYLFNAFSLIFDANKWSMIYLFGLI